MAALPTLAVLLVVVLVPVVVVLAVGAGHL
jgi:hypothetical protein